MPIEIPTCCREYRWQQQLPVLVSLTATMCLPDHVSMSLCFGEDFRNQFLALSLAQNPAGHGHLVLKKLAHSGCQTELAVTDDLLHLLLNCTVTLLVATCLRLMSLGGAVPFALFAGSEAVGIPWREWGFQTMPARQRILARVRDLNVSKMSSRTGLFPTRLKEGDFSVVRAVNARSDCR